MGRGSLKPAINCTSRTFGTQIGKLVYLFFLNPPYCTSDNYTLRIIVRFFRTTEKRVIIRRLLYMYCFNRPYKLASLSLIMFIGNFKDLNFCLSLKVKPNLGIISLCSYR